MGAATLLAVLGVGPSRVASVGALQAGGLTGIPDVAAPVRAVIAFGTIAAIGGGFLWRDEAFVDRCVSAALETPVRAALYGGGAHVVIAFGTLYVADQLSPVRVSGYSGASVGVVLGLGVALLAGGLGFTIVGSVIVDYATGGRPRNGLLVGATIAGGVALLQPVYGGLLWLVIVSMGVGGPIKRWFHASAGT